MASDKLDTLWDGWVTTLSGGYARSLELLDQGNTEAAVFEFRKSFVWTVKKLYSEVGDTYPLRYQKAACWTDWTKRLYVLTRKAEDAFLKGDIKAARELLPQLRAHFHDLHVQTGRQRSNDLIYAFLQSVEDGEASREQLLNLEDRLRNAEPSSKAKADAQGYEAARTAWLEQVAPILADVQGITAAQREQLRAATRAFYQSYGIQFE